MANLNSSKDIKNYVLFHAGEPTDGTSDFDGQCVIEMNRAYEELWRGGSNPFTPTLHEKWWWLRTEGAFILEPERTGNVDVTNGSTAITLSSGFGTSSVDLGGYFFKVDSHSDVFRIATGYTGTDTSLTLDTVYTGTTASAVNYTMFRLDYDLPTTLYELIEPMLVYHDGPKNIFGISEGQLQRDYPYSLMDSGSPTRFAPIGEKKVRFNKHGGTATTEFIRVDYDYLTMPTSLGTTTADVPLIPKQYRSILADMTLHYVLEVKGETTAGDIAVRAKAGINAMVKENRRRWPQTGLAGQIQPRQGELSRFKGPLRSESGMILG